MGLRRREPRLSSVVSRLGAQVGLGGNVFSPLSLAPAFWYRADAGLYQERTGASATTLAAADADPVGSWLDQSGNARHLTAAADSNRPALKLAIQNGKPVVRFDAVDDYLTATFALTQPETVFIAFRVRTNQGAGGFFDGLTLNSMLLFESIGLNIFAGAAVGPAATLTNNTAYIAKATFNGASSALAVNNGTAATGNAGASNGGGFTVGSRGGGANFQQVDACEVVGFGRETTPAEDASLWAYLDGHWGAY